MRKIRVRLDPDFIMMSFVALVLAICLIGNANAKDVRTVRLDQTTVARIFVTPGRSTVLSFPTKPTKVILGNQGIFAVEYVENDLAVAALSPHSHSDLFVYIEGRRFAFDLSSIPSGGDTIVLVRDVLDNTDTSSKPHPKSSPAPKVKLQEKRHG